MVLTHLKFFLKKVKKGVDKGREVWYNNKAVAEKAVAESVIENWTTKGIEYKAKRSAKQKELEIPERNSNKK